MSFLKKIFSRLEPQPQKTDAGALPSVLSKVFQANYYLGQLKDIDVAPAHDNPLAHYLTSGWRQGVNPHRYFDVNWYLTQYPDVAAAGIEPLGHYISLGWKENRQPHQFYDSNEYLSRHPKLLRFDTCPLILLNGLYEPVIEDKTNNITELQPALNWPSFYPNDRPYAYLTTEVFSHKINTYRKTKQRSNKVVFYTCITNNYDTLRLPEVLSPDFDYVLFTDRPTEGYGVFDVRLIQSTEEDPIRASRSIKFHPHHHLPDYDVAVWFDANVVLREDFHPHLDGFKKSGQYLAFLPNPIYNCLYEDAALCAQTGKDRREKIAAQMVRYQQEGYPRKNGLFEANLFATRPKELQTKAFLDSWWDEISSGSRRDQLSGNYALWKHGLTYFPFLGEGQNTRTHPSVALLSHGIHDASCYAPLTGNASPPS